MHARNGINIRPSLHQPRRQAVGYGNEFAQCRTKTEAGGGHPKAPTPDTSCALTLKKMSATVWSKSKVPRALLAGGQSFGRAMYNSLIFAEEAAKARSSNRGVPLTLPTPADEANPATCELNQDGKRISGRM